MGDSATKRAVTFRHPFTLPGMAEPHAAGTFEVLIDAEALDVSFAAHVSRLRLMLTYRGRTEALPISAADLEAALLADQQQSST
jgi:hypothetical protein